MSLQNKSTSLGGPLVQAPTIESVKLAVQTLNNICIRTPIVDLGNYDYADDISLKVETLQPIGSYKIRGVYNWAASLTKEQLACGLSTHSAGNTAQALGYVSRLLNVKARSILPDTTPLVKVKAIKQYGVTPVMMPFAQQLDFALNEGWKQEPYTWLNPWGDQMMITGNGTIALEILEDCPDVETVFIPVGGGGLMAGVGSVLKELKPSVQIIGVQAEACPALHAAFEQGSPLWVESQDTICEGVAVPFISDEIFPLLSKIIDKVVLISETSARKSIKRIAIQNNLVVEGSGGLSVAAALSTPQSQRGKSVCILSGSTIEPSTLADIITTSEN
ncbi:MAG: threonine dehydratase [Chloroflexi bacterium]|jgi:threonine dehydratase|nr:MAG: threonine dehydratase [Chloroflexota bacterium]